jgi:translation initiation factor 3 subunit B
MVQEQQEVVIRGGLKMEVQVRIPLDHMPGVPALATFSAADRYVITWTNYPKRNPLEPGKVTIWDMSTGLECRSFQDVAVFEEVESPKDGRQYAEPTGFPPFKWSFDDKFFAKMEKDSLAIYETSTWRLVGDKKVEIAGVAGFSWSPTSNTLAYWVPEIGQVPARVVLLDVPDLVEIKKRTMFKVEQIGVEWHPQGTYCMIQSTKTGQQGMTLDILRMKVKDIPVESIVLPATDRVRSCHFEPLGDRLALVMSATSGMAGTEVTMIRFYTLEKNKYKLETTIRRPHCEHFLWNPRGRFAALFGLEKSSAGLFEFIDVQEGCAVTGNGRHFRCNRYEWDPSGRYFLTALTYTLKTSSDLGFTIWNIRGKKVEDEVEQLLWQVCFRPRPPVLGAILNEDDIRRARASVKDKSIRYEREDKMLAQALSQEEIYRRQRMLEEFSRWKTQWEDAEQDHRQYLRSKGVLFEPSDADFVEFVEEYERVLEVLEETELAEDKQES